MILARVWSGSEPERLCSFEEVEFQCEQVGIDRPEQHQLDCGDQNRDEVGVVAAGRHADWETELALKRVKQRNTALTPHDVEDVV